MMKPYSLRVLTSAAITTIGLLTATGQANAFSLTGATLSVAMECDNDVSALVVGKNPQGQWQYAHDAAGDGSGGLHYEIYGMGFMEDAKYAYFAINAYDMERNAGIDTVDAKGKTDYKIGWGDLLISTKGQSMAKNNGNIFGIHFGGNSGGVSQIGLYSHVTAKSVTKNHQGFDSIAGVLEHGQKSHVIALDEYLTQKGVKDAYNTANLQQKWSFSTYLKNQSLEVRNAYNSAASQQNWNLETYLKTLLKVDQLAYQQKDWNFSQYVNSLPLEDKTAYNNADSQQNKSLNDYLKTLPQADQLAYQQKDWNFSQYVNSLPLADKTAYNNADLQQNKSLSDYLKTLPQADQLAYQQKDWNFSQYFNSLPSADKTAYNNASQFLNKELTFEQYLDKQSSKVKTDYKNGDQTTKDRIKNELFSGAQNIVNRTVSAYEQFKQNAQAKADKINGNYEQFKQNAKANVDKTKTAYEQFKQNAQVKANTINANYEQFKQNAKANVDKTKTAYEQFKQNAQVKANTINANYEQFKQDAQAKVNKTKSDYEQFKQDAKNTVAEIRAPYDELANNFQNTLFGDLSNEQALNYFDQQGSNVIQSGIWLAGIEMLSLEQLMQAGYNQNQFLGSQTIAFRIARSKYSPESIPEPTAIFGLAAIGLGITSGKLRKQNQLD
ncbi:hypothetical protein LC593_27645 [Nostoc sp. CHAB 5844]|nr:hypothetical protein [Nostoc sp. CHAB 5844]